MSTSKLMKVTYYDPKSQIRLLCYADTVVWDTKPTPTLTALRFGGYPERVQGLADAIYGGATIEIEDGKDTYSLKTLTRQYRRELSHDGVYAEATLIAEDDGQSAKQNAGDKDEPDKDKNDEDDDQIQQDLPPRNTYIFCTPGERRELFDAVDQKTAVPMIPEYRIMSSRNCKRGISCGHFRSSPCPVSWRRGFCAVRRRTKTSSRSWRMDSKAERSPFRVRPSA